MLGNSARILLIGEINWWTDTNSADFTRQVDELLAAGVEKVELYINSPGGNPWEAGEIANQVKRFTGEKTARLGIVCASSATLPALACDKVLAGRFSMFMIHEPSIEAYGTTDELQKSINQLEAIKTLALQMYVAKCGKPEEDVRAKMKAETWFTAQEAIDYGFVDGYYDEVPDSSMLLLEAPQLERVPAQMLATNQLIVDNMLKNRLAVAMRLPESTTDDQLVAAIEKLVGDNARLALENQDAKKAAVKEAAKMFASSLVDQKKITEAERQEYEEAYTASPEVAAKMALKLQPVMQASAHINPQSQGTLGAAPGETFGDLMKTNPTMLVKMRSENPEKYKALYKAEYGVEPEIS
jgi:ATP-dependent protease ClpP protease subunit